MLLTLISLISITSCSKDDDDNSDKSSTETKVVVNEDGTTSNGSNFTAFDDKNFYLDYIKYTVEEGHLVVSGYDKAGFKGDARIVSSITYKQNTYEVLEIGNYAFSGCRVLTNIELPRKLTSIGHGAFQNCIGLTNVIIPNNVTSIGSGVFAYCAGLTSITIPNSVTSIVNGTFHDCSSLTSVIIPNSVNSIDERAFENCSSLTSVIIPNSVKSIDRYAFYKCSSLASVTIGNSVTSIGMDAFVGCAGLKHVYCYAEQLPTGSSSAFYSANTSNATLHVPASMLSVYKSVSPWKYFGKIVALTDDDPSPENIGMIYGS